MVRARRRQAGGALPVGRRGHALPASGDRPPPRTRSAPRSRASTSPGTARRTLARCRALRRRRARRPLRSRREVADAEARALAEPSVRRSSVIAASDAAICRRGLIHGDLFRDNVLWHEGGRIAALLDFESAHDGPFAYDLAVTILSWSFRDDVRHGRRARDRRGLRSVRELEQRARGALRRSRLRRATLHDHAHHRRCDPRRQAWQRFVARREAIERLGPAGCGGARAVSARGRALVMGAARIATVLASRVVRKPVAAAAPSPTRREAGGALQPVPPPHRASSRSRPELHLRSAAAVLRRSRGSRLQLVPSPGARRRSVRDARQRREPRDDRAAFGMRWQLTPVLWSWGCIARVAVAHLRRRSARAPWRLARAASDLEYIVGHVERLLCRPGVRAYLPLVQRGEYLSVSLGTSIYALRRKLRVAYDVGAYVLSGSSASR